MKTYLVIDKNGNWQLLKKEQVGIYSLDSNFQVYKIITYILPYIKTGVEWGIIIWLMYNTRNFSTPNLQLAFIFLLLLQLERRIRW